MKKLANIIKALIYFLPLTLYFSYYPIISIGSSDSMNFELSLPLLWLVIFDILSLILLIKNRKLKFSKNLFLILLCPIFITISVLWSTNFLRGFLTAGILWLIIFAIYALRIFFKTIDKPKFIKIFFASSLAICAWCFIQSFLDFLGVSRDVTLMCYGCTTKAFGFPHPNGFAIEPQFMGNLLLAPAILSIYLLLTNSKYFSKKFLYISVVIFTTTLFFVFSRGAIYSFAVSLVLMLIFFVIKSRSTRPLFMLAPILLSFVLSLNFQGLFAEFSSTNDTYFSGIAKSISQLSLGIIDFTNTTKPTQTPSTGQSSTGQSSAESTFDGYVEESTNVRVGLTNSALKVWSKNSTTIFFGVGLGGAGEALYQAGEIATPKEIVQNELASLLLETGLLGVLLLIFALIIIFKTSNYQTSFFVPLFVAYILSLFFFSGLPNALHIYLNLGLSTTKSKH